MNTRYVLIDHENVQPKDLDLLHGQPFRVIVFLGANQAKLSADLAMALQARGQDGAYVKVCATGRNALDLHIAFHIGELAAKEPSASFCVISKDGDYDPLLHHLRSRGIDARREVTLAALLQSPDDKLAQIVAYLKAAGASRPRRAKTLGNAIKARLGNNLEPPEIERMIKELERHAVITLADGKVAYF